MSIDSSPAYLERAGRPDSPDDLSSHCVVTLQLSGVAVTSWTLSNDDDAKTVALGSPLCGDGHFARQCALAGKGIARKVLFDVIDDLEVGRLVQVLPRYTGGVTQIHAVFPSRRFMPSRVRAVDAALSEAFVHRAERCRSWFDRTG